MGVTRTNIELFATDYIEDELERSSDETEEVNNRQKKNQGKGRTRSYKMKDYTDIHNNAGGKRKLNAKQARRLENLRAILSMVEKEDLDFDLNNMYEPRMSVFAELFMEREKMKIWNDFLNRSEEEQQSFLRESTGWKHSSKVKVNVNMASTSAKIDDASESSDANNTWEEIPDRRVAHPAFTAAEAFQRIDTNLRSLLRKRQLPKGTLACLEEDLMSFFSEWPSSVYVSQIPSSFERMLLHALCQYLDLSSKSYDFEGTRQTHVENKHEEFIPPDVLLTQYIENITSQLQVLGSTG